MVCLFSSYFELNKLVSVINTAVNNLASDEVNCDHGIVTISKDRVIYIKPKIVC